MARETVATRAPPSAEAVSRSMKTFPEAATPRPGPGQGPPPPLADCGTGERESPIGTSESMEATNRIAPKRAAPLQSLRHSHRILTGGSPGG